MRNHEMVMSIRESQRLKELEKVIAKGQKTFVEVGLALVEIRDLRLFKGEYSSFTEYCQKKWGWEQRYTRYVIAGAEAVRSLPEGVGTLVHHEAAARELAKVEAGQRAGVVQTIVAEGRPVTAREVKRHLPPPPGQVVDGTGWAIPTQLIPLWQRSHEVQDKLFAEVNFSSALSKLDQAWTDIKTAKPFAVCPTCQGQLPDKCTLCKGRGLISEHRWNTCVTREDKEFRARAKQKSGNGKERA